MQVGAFHPELSQVLPRYQAPGEATSAHDDASDTPSDGVFLSRSTSHASTATLAQLFAEAEALAQSPEIHVPPALSLVHKTRAFLSLAAHEPNYRRNGSAMAVAQTSNALVNCTYLLAMQAAGTGGDAAVAAMLADLVRYAAAVIAFHQRDNEDLHMTPDSPQSKRAQLCRSIALHGVADTACNLAMLAGLAKTGLQPEDAALTRAVALGANLGKTYLATRYFGLWSCLKVHLGDATARALQRDYNRTIGAFEFIVFGLISGTGGSALYLKLREAMGDSPTNLLGPALACMTAAGTLSLAFDTNFILQGGQSDAPEGTTTPPERRELTSLGAKLRAFCQLVGRDPDYRKHLIALSGARLGLGLTTAGYLHLMNIAGSPADVAMIGMAEDFVRFLGYLVAHHERDNEDLARAQSTVAARRATLSSKLAGCLVPDALGTAGVMMGLWLTMKGNSAPLATRGIIAATKLLDTYVRNREGGYWGCLKVHLGDESARQRQDAINRTINSIENVFLSLLVTAASVGVYMLLNVEGGQNTPQAAFTCLGAVALGLTFQVAGRAVFAYESSHWKHVDSLDAASVVREVVDNHEVTPLLA